jgi:hypothetical protein
MKANLKAVVLSIVIFAMLFFAVHTLLSIYFNIEDTRIIALIAGTVAFVFSPRRVILRKQSGREIHLKWLFSNKIIRFK